MTSSSVLRYCGACDVLAAEEVCWLCGGAMVVRKPAPPPQAHTFLAAVRRVPIAGGSLVVVDPAESLTT